MQLATAISLGLGEAGPRPRERLAMVGTALLSDAELLAIVLGTGSPALPVSVLAVSILERVGGLRGLAQLSLTDLELQEGVGNGKASRLLAAFELGLRVQCQPFSRKRAIVSSRDVDAALRPRLRNEPREYFIAIALDAKNQPVAELTIAIGGLTACSITPGDVYRPVLQAAAVSVIFVHNHPSGDPNPSEADIAITKRLVRAGQLLGISVFDHVVLGNQNYFSFADAGLLEGMSGSASTS